MRYLDQSTRMRYLAWIEITHLQARALLLFHYELSKLFTTLSFCRARCPRLNSFYAPT